MTAKPSDLAPVRRPRRFRRAQPTDAGRIAALVDSREALRQVSPLETFPLDRATVLHWLLERDAGYVLEDEGEIVAYGELVPDDHKSARVWIGHMIVHPRRRGLGLGQRLVRELLEVAEQERGAREVAISAFADNPRALRCYEACGFERVDQERVEGRPLVGMRRRFASRRRSPRTMTFVVTGLVGVCAGAVLWPGQVGALLAAQPWVLGTLVVQSTVAALALPLRRERRESWSGRLRAATLRAAVAAAIAFGTGLALLAASGAGAYAGTLTRVYASATLVWVALLGLDLWRARRS